ncbi:MAG: TIGR00725 family protein, partial [Candidatus Caldatribacteriota bacterium]|nr:TIGR00725 family protein [Candidatus Caldatribacteriota bacterium]
MGGGEVADPIDYEIARKLGCLIAKESWVLLNGGRASGMMEASARGAKEGGGLTIGILPGDNSSWASEYIDIPILTGIGFARNYINVQTSEVVVALPGKTGTISEIALALNIGKKVISLNFNLGILFKKYTEDGQLIYVKKPEEVIVLIKNLLNKKINKEMKD